MIERAALEDDELLVLAGDNLFELSLPRFVEWWRAKPQPASAVPLHDVGDLELATHYGIADTDADDRIVRFVEKPSDPPSTLASTLIYLLPPEHVRLVRDLPRRGPEPGQRRQLPRLARRAGAGLRLPLRRAAGTTSGTTRSCSRRTTGMRRLAGLPERESYSLD